MSVAQQILQALQKTVMGTSTEEIKTAESVLKGLESSEEFVDNIALILLESKVDYNLQKSAAIYLTKHASNVVKSKNQPLINKTAEKILSLLANYKINIKIKSLTARALELIITNDKAKIIRMAFEPNLLNELAQIEQQSDDKINFQLLLFLGQVLMNNPGFTQEVWRFISKSFLPFLKLTLRIQNLLEQALLAKNGELAAKLLFLAKEFIYLLKMYLKRFLFIDIEANKLLFVPQLQNVISKALQLSIPNNQLSYPIFHMVTNPTEEQKLLNEIKANTISFLYHLIRTLLGVVREPKILQLNPVFIKTSQYLVTMILSTQQIMKFQPYYKLTDMSILNTLDEVYTFFGATITANVFYSTFSQYKEKIIEDIIFRALTLTPQDYENYYESPEEFIYTLIHIIDRDVKLKTRKDVDQQQDQVQMFTTVRTNAALFLNHFCKHQDGTLTEIMQYAFLILQGKVNAQFSPNLMLFIITILKDVSKERRDLHLKISNIVMKQLNQLEMPRKSTEQPESKNKNKELDIQYSLILLLLSKMFVQIQCINPKIIDYAFKLCYNILNDKKVEEVPKLLAIDIIEVINHMEEGQPYSPDILKTFNILLKQGDKPSQRLLQAYFSLIKYNDVILKKMCYKQLCQMVNILANQIEKQVKSQKKEQILINKMWNVIRDVGENPQFIPTMIQPIQNAIMPLLPFVDGVNENDFQEDILMLMSAFIGKSHQVTHNQLKMFEIIPKIFYGHYKAVFGHSFETMQTFIYYGKDILKTAPAAINSIIHMGLTSIFSKEYKNRKLLESDNCEGALLIQSLIIACGFSIQLKSYEEIVQTVQKRLGDKTIKFNLLSSNLIALLALVLVHTCQTFSNEINDMILSTILNSISCFQKVKHSPKILIISLNKLVTKWQLQFVQRRFTQILDTIITLLQMITLRKDNLFEEDDDDQERDYDNSLVQTINQVIKMDEFQDFKSQIKLLREQNLALIQSTVNELPQSKKDFLKNVLAVERVSNQPRKIFSIKRNK